MKKIFYFLMAITLIGCASSSVRHNLNPGEGYYESTDEHAKTQNEAFVAAMEWIATHYNDADKVIQMSDKDAGIIVAKGMSQISVFTQPVYFGYTLKIKFKENKVKFEFTTGTNHNGYYPPADSMDDLKKEYSAIKISIMNKVNSSDSF